MTPPLPVVYLHTGGGLSIDGAIRFQKLVFLGQKESKLPEHYRFVPYKFGPYSYQLHRDIHTCIDQGYISRNYHRNEVGNYRADYSVTPDGIKYAQKLQNVEGFEKIFKNSQRIKKKFNDWEISGLLEYVYRKYPEYTDESTLDIERLFTESTTSQFLDQDDKNQGPFDQIAVLDETEARLAGTDDSFTRQSIELGSHLQMNLERFDDGSLSIYWRSSVPFEQVIQAIQDDTAVPSDARCEMRTGGSQDWVRNGCSSILDDIQPSECLFFRTQAENQRFTLAWERGVGDQRHEITLFVSEDKIDYQSLRSTLARYVSVSTENTDSIHGNRIKVTDDRLSESLRQTAKLAVS